jgi:ubiquinone/menaquinone biosynthesis C-methylase UbiE
MNQQVPVTAFAEIKECCAQLYSSDMARLLVGESLHPGGAATTSRVAVLLQLDSSCEVLDVACGRGASAIHLARTVGCRVVGMDLSAENVEAASQAAEQAGVAYLCTFTAGDAESLAADDATFDAVICECAFCTFPDKPSAAREFARVLRPGGRVGVADLTRVGPAQRDLDGLLAWVACIADARSIDGYSTLLAEAGLQVEHTETHDEALLGLIERVRARLVVGRVLGAVRSQATAGWDIARAQELASAALVAVHAGTLGYAIITARRR